MVELLLNWGNMKTGIFSLIFSAILFGCNMPEQPALTLLLKHELKDFSSASAIEFYNNRLYVAGDDSRHLLVLDKAYNTLESLELFKGTSHRIPKKEKSDLEASTIVPYKNKPHLFVAGSSSTETREVFFLFPLDSLMNYERLSASAFCDSLRNQGLINLNLEGLTTVNELLVFANRANLGHPHNQLIVLPAAFIAQSGQLHPAIIEFLTDRDTDTVKGVSGLAYIPSLDLLLFTASIEETASTYEDGAIGDSFLGYVKNFSARLNDRKITADAIFNLSQLDAVFSGEKIESVTVESVTGEEIILHLVADNDDGTSTLFKMKLVNPSR